ncbi:hypothetical protein [Krasilnikovia sp. MM14-A1259]|uniref:hypothetical protein n=1 Tax=Krasilnikovia sp. MM14-A1259 TaxID=3373539 RepID=UPI0037F3C3C2
MSTLVPPLFAGLVDDAVLLPPNDTDAGAAAAAYRAHAAAWYAPLLGSLLVPSSLARRTPPVGDLAVGVVCDSAIDGLGAAIAGLRDAGAVVCQVEAAVARRGEDPQPGLRELRALATAQPDLDVYAEIPLSWGLLAALDTVAEGRSSGQRIGAKFRVGGLAAELFPTPVELAAVICACRDRDLPFKLAVGQRHALRHTDPETGFTHHGFLNVLVGCITAVDGAEVAEVAEVLAATHPVPLMEPARVRRDGPRPLLAGFGARDIRDPLTELIRVGMINGGFE